MRARIVAATAALLSTAAASGAAATTKTQHYSGRAGAGDAYAMSFDVVRGHVTHFTFVSRCPGLKNGTRVAARMRIVRHRFSFHDAQFTLTGHFLRGGMARGTERDRTGDCDSGLLTWSARRS